MSIFLLQTSTLTINRYLPGYYQGGKWVQGGLDTPFDIECSIQPFKQGKERVLLPEGTTTNDVVIVYSKTLLNVADQWTDTDGDYTTIDGREYKCYTVENWLRYGLLADNAKHLFVRRNLPTGGSL